MLFLGRMPFLLTAIMCVTVLGMAVILEYGFGIVGCALCHYERMVIAFGGGLAFLGLLLPPPLRSKGFLTLAFIFFAGFGLSLYHVLIQHHVLPLPSFCKPPSISNALSLEDMRQQLLDTPFVPCNKVTWSLFGLSLAAYSAIMTGLLCLYNIIALKKSQHDK